jgi:hypothetical protein
MHFPNGPVNLQDIVELPSSLLLMLASEARWHYEYMRKRGKTVIWRALPRVGKRPAELGYANIRKNADEVMNLWDEQPHYGEEWFVPYNELDLNYERGDNKNDFEGLRDRYHLLSTFLIGIYSDLRNRLPLGTRILFPPWTPDHGDIEHVEQWRDAANMYDGLVIHAYESPQEMLDRFHWYAEQFPGKIIFIGEWNSHTPEEFIAALKTLEDHPQFGGAIYFVWKWHNPAGWWPNEYDVEGNESMLSLFREAEEPMPEFPVYPEHAVWSEDEIVSESNRKADTFGIPRRVLLGLLYAESGLKQFSTRAAYRNQDGSYTNLTNTFNSGVANRDYAVVASVLDEVVQHGSNDVSFGVGQQTVRWSDEGDHTHSVENVLYIRNLYFNPAYAIEVAGRKIAGYWRTYGDDLEALCRYNKPNIPGEQNGNRANYIRGLESADNKLSQQEEPPQETFMKVTVKRTGNSTSPFPAPPRGFILHGSRSGSTTNTKAQEAAGTANWCVINPNDLSWHATIGENEYYIHMPMNRWGWNARSASNDYIAVEFAQAQRGEAISEAQIDAFVHFVQNEVLPVYPNMPLVMKTHADVEKSGETGVIDGKDDVFAYQSAESDDIKRRILSKLQGEQPMPEYQFHFGFAAKAEELGHDVVGDPVEDENYISQNYSLQMSEKGVMIYSKTANRVHFLKAE